MPPSEAEIVFNSRLETLYTHPFRVATEGEGRFLSVIILEDGSQEVLMELTSRIRVQLIFLKKQNDVADVRISKYRYNKRLGWRADKEEHIKLNSLSLNRIATLLSFLSGLDLASIDERRIRLGEDTLPEIDEETKLKLRTLFSRTDGTAMIEELLRSNIISSKDLVNIGYRKAQLAIFERLLHEEGFVDQYKSDENVHSAGTESAWQHFFEKNPWVFGYGLNYVWCDNLPDSALEQYVAGFDFNADGKRVDGLLHTAAHLSHFVLVEIKTPKASLTSRQPRPGVWSISSDLLEGVAQIQKTVSRFKQQYFEKAQLKDDDGNPLNIDVFNYSPRSYLLIGSLDEFQTERGVNSDKYSSFQLFRNALRDPEIITFDELYARAEAIVKHSDK